ncbi:MAG: hypothetical protein H7320_01165 [Ferruginibacter sp.]|nr:hypothetical protein [Ferruginibacter sp.]
MEIVAFFIAAIFCSKVFAQDTVKITAFGYRLNLRENAWPIVKEALTACKIKIRPVLVFPKNRYDFWPQYSAEKLFYKSNNE